eukprot:snap_masked-scaffold_48-processed-gene-0.25-mRNA-1 protein AED:0.07 eAED:0.07 QI:0/-1/0/1/-1/1/1/0/359
MKAFFYEGRYFRKEKVGLVKLLEEIDLKPGQLLLEVKCAALNPLDYKVRGAPFLPIISRSKNLVSPVVHGFDFCGKVLSQKQTSGKFENGDFVFGMIKGLHIGTCAERIIVEEDICALKPENISYEEAASIPLVGITSIQCFETSKQLDKPRVLVLGGSGGVGSVFIQLAKNLFNASFIATTSSGRKKELCEKLGADLVIDYKKDPELETIKEEEFDFILHARGDVLPAFNLIKEGGTICSLTYAPTAEGIKDCLINSGSYSEIISPIRWFLNSSFGNSLLNLITGASKLKKKLRKKRAHWTSIMAYGNGERMKTIAKEMEEGRLRAVIDKVYKIDDAVEAMKHLEEGHAAGKVLISFE